MAMKKSPLRLKVEAYLEKHPDAVPGVVAKVMKVEPKRVYAMINQVRAVIRAKSAIADADEGMGAFPDAVSSIPDSPPEYFPFYVSVREGYGLEVTVGQATMLIDKLHVESNSNWKYPHLLISKESRIALTDEQLVRIVAEYLRYSLTLVDVDGVDVIQEQRHFFFHYKQKSADVAEKELDVD